MAGADPAAYAEILEARLVARASDGPLAPAAREPTPRPKKGETRHAHAQGT
jgi:hypothetical protein